MARPQGYGSGQQRYDQRGNSRQSGGSKMGTVIIVGILLLAALYFLGMAGTAHAAPDSLILKQYDSPVPFGIQGDMSAKDIQSQLSGVVVVDSQATALPFTLTNTRTGEVATGNPASVHVSAGDVVTVQFSGPNGGGTAASAKVTLPYRTYLPGIVR